MTVSLDEQEDIRRMDRDGATRADIARELHLSRNTVRKYADMEDMSPEPPAGQERPHQGAAENQVQRRVGDAADSGDERFFVDTPEPETGQ